MELAINAGSIIASLDLDTGQFSTKLEKAQKQADGFAGKLKGYGGAFEDLGKGLTLGVTAPVAGLGTVAAKSAIDFESAFAGVIKTVDATDSQLAKLQTGIRGMSKEIPASATAIAGVAEAAGQLGIGTDNILSFSRVMIDLGESTNLSADEAATALARLANITGMSQQDFDRLGSTIVDLGNNLATTESEIVAMGLRLAGAGSQIGLSEAQIMSFSGALSSVGIEAEAGGSAFSKVMIEMQLAVETNSKKLGEFADVAGMSASEFKRAFQEDAAGAIITFIQGLGNAEEKGLSAIKVLDDMGITEVRLRDALLRASGASDVFTNSLEIGTKAWEENTALTKEAEQRYKTTASQIEIAKNYLKDAGITIGEKVVPHIVSLAEGVKKASEWFSDLNPKTQETIVKMAGLAAATGPVIYGTGKMASGLGSTIGLFNKFGVGAKVASTAASALGGASGLGSVVVSGTEAGGVIASLGGAAGGGGLLGSLTTGLGTSLAAMAPWALGIGAAGVAAYGLYKYLNQDAIPEVDLFADKVEYSTSAMNEFSHTAGISMETTVTKISEGTKKAVEAYLELDEGATSHLNNLYINSVAITEENSTELKNRYSEMANTINATLEKKRDEELVNLQNFFKDSVALTKSEQANILQETMKHHSNLQSENNKNVFAIKEILDKAANERRELYSWEQQEINRIQEEMKTNAIKTLSENEIEAKIILERMKEYDGRITAEMASEHIKEINRLRDDSIAAANKEYEDRVATIIRMRDESGVISTTQADKLIQEAQRQRDETIKAVEETRKGAIDKMKSMFADLENIVDTGTGKILSLWDKLKRWWEGWKPESKTFSYSIKGSGQVTTGGNVIMAYAQGTNFAPGGWALVGEQGPELVELPRGSKVYTNQETNEIVGKSKGDIIQHITLISPTPLSPSESARKYKQASQQLAMEWGY